MRSALLLLVAGSCAVAGFWGSEVLLASGRVCAFDATADSSGAIWAAVASPDSAVRLYCSSDFGSTWHERETLRAASSVRQVQLLSGPGDSSSLFVFLLEEQNGGDLWVARIALATGNLTLAPVAVGPDTIDDFSAALDRDERYYLYCLYANEHRTGRTGTFTRSLDYGASWEAGTDWWNAWDPCVSYTNGSTVHCSWRYALNGGEIHYSRNQYYAQPGHWSAYRLVSDSFAGPCFDPTLVQADSSPESQAAVWVFYVTGRRDTELLDLAYSASYDGGSAWTPGLPFGSSFRDEQQPRLAADLSGSGGYVSLCYTSGNRRQGDTVSAWWTCANSFDLDGWLEPVKISRLPLADLVPRPVYVPHAPMRLPGVFYSQQADSLPWGVRFAAPWLSPARSSHPDTDGPAARLWPNPATGTVRVSAIATAPGNYSLAVYDASGRLVSNVLERRFAAGPLSWTWNRTSPAGRRIPAGTFFLRLRGPGTDFTRRLLLL